MKTRCYLAYGSNLNIEQMRFRCPEATIIGTGEIQDYQLLFKGSQTGDYLTIEPMEGASVPVVAWAVNAKDEASLDKFEGFPHCYYKTEMKLLIRNSATGKKRIRRAFVYIMHEERKLGVPSSRYVRKCLAGYSAFGFDPTFLHKAFKVSLGVRV